MSSKSIRTFAFAFIIVGFAALKTSAQIRLLPIQQSRDFRQTNHRVAGEGRDSTQLTLPFWDDFSTDINLPDTGRWFVDIGTANVSAGAGIDPPTLNVAVFDGWNNQGSPYSTTELAEGPGDSLVSRFIDLATLTPSQKQSVYISFFWEKEGRGEMPDPNDSIRLQFKDSENHWVTKWSVTGAGMGDPNKFFQQIIKVDGQAFFHPYFQFRFQSFGRLSGGYDSWLLDYIYMNYNRSANSLAYEDRALTSRPTSFLTRYTAMPYRQFIQNLTANLQPIQVGFYNMDAQVQPIEFSSLIRDTTGILDKMNEGTVLDPNPLGFERRTIVSQPIDPNVFDAQADTLSMEIESVFFINSGDSIQFGKLDYRVNDTTRSTVLLDKELAYDDGTAEWAAGLSQSRGQIAYRFILNRPDAVTGVKMYLPDFGAGLSGKSFSIIVWDHLTSGVEGRLLVEDHIIQPSAGLDQFNTYTFGRPVAVADTFYIGFQQNLEGFFPVGLDKNTDSSDEIFINTDGSWQKSDKLTGSLMIRPVFGFRKAVGLEDDLVFKDLRIFPNPSNGLFRIKGDFSDAWIFDVFGRQLQHVTYSRGGTIVDLAHNNPGIYLIKILKDNQYKTFKVVLR